MVSEEELKNMSPEEISEMQKKNCIFCHIISGKVQSKKIYEDDKAMVILDINPANPGHLLLIPKEHQVIMPQLPDAVVGHMFMLSKHLSQACLKALKCQGTNIFVANGAIAGQKAPHFMIHIIPRKEKDGLTQFNIVHNDIKAEDQKQVFTRLKKKVNEMFGIPDDVEDEVVEAEYKEEEKVEKKKEEKKDEIVKEKKGKGKKVKKKKEKDDDIEVNLDDIAGLLG